MSTVACCPSAVYQPEIQPDMPRISSGDYGKSLTMHCYSLDGLRVYLDVQQNEAQLVHNAMLPSSKYIGVNEMNVKHVISISDKLQQIRETGLFHDCAGSSATKNDVICRALAVSSQIPSGFDVFPTGRNSVQFEYEEKSRKYIELEIFSDKFALLYMSDEKTIKYENDNIINLNEAIKKANEFYEL